MSVLYRVSCICIQVVVMAESEAQQALWSLLQVAEMCLQAPQADAAANTSPQAATLSLLGAPLGSQAPHTQVRKAAPPAIA